MTTTKPPKEMVRASMEQQRLARVIENKVRAPEEIRRELGWGLVQPSTRSR